MPHRPVTLASRASVLRDAKAVIEADLASDLDIEDVARRVATSRRQLQRCFRELGGTTFRDHLVEARMRRAAELLRTTPMTVREIAGAVGYRQPAQFAKAFRRIHGLAPNEFRARRFVRATATATAAAA